jgi:tetratricopeptide (TPR) repeat protein
MSWTTIGLLATAILALQGISILRRSGTASHVRWFGGLALLLAALSVISFMLFISGSLVLSPELGIVLLEKSWLRFILGPVFVGVAVAGGLVWHIARSDANWNSRLLPLMFVALLVGILAAARLHTLNTDEPAALRVYSYDLLWPPFLVWLVVCLAQTALTILRVKAWSTRSWVTVAFVGGVSLHALLSSQFTDPASQRLWQVTLRASLALLLALAIWQRRQFRSWLRTFHSVKPSKQWWRPGLLLFSLFLVATSLVALFTVSFEPRIFLTLFIVGWGMAAELVTGGPIQTLFRNARMDIAEIEGFVRGSARRILKGTAHAATSVKEAVKKVVESQHAATAVVKIFLGVVLLVALDELPNTGKTIIEPFTSNTLSSKTKIGQAMSEQVFHELEVLNQQLQPAAILPERSSDSFISYVALRSGTETMNTVFDETKGIDIGSVHIPMTLLLKPVQGPMHSLLRVRLISGTVEADNQTISALASSSTGVSWLAQVERRQKAAPISDSTFANRDIADLAQQLAFKIISTDPKLSKMGMTTSWEGFNVFRQGLARWNDFETRQEVDRLTWDTLSVAIDDFLVATRLDPRFALAHYRLGVALQADGQPTAADQAFRAAIAANPSFVAPYNALAYQLFTYDTYYPSPAAPLSPRRPAEPETKRSRIEEAHRLWRQALLLATDDGAAAEKASAYYGLCLYWLRARHFDLAYFSCKRSGELYASLSTTLFAEEKLKDAEALTANEMAVALEWNRFENETIPSADWVCVARPVDTLGHVGSAILIHSPYAGAALRYYRRSLEQRPSDPDVLCNAASSAYVLGDLHPMQALDSTAAAHWNLGNSYADQARIAEKDRVARALYRQALDEFKKAIVLDPADADALNDYAYTVWSWRLRGSEDSLPTPVMRQTAESYARSAATLSTIERSGMLPDTRSTVAEMLLAQARPHEAITELVPVVRVIPQHVQYDEIRWELAQAYLCAAAIDERTGASNPAQVLRFRKAAVPLLESIRDHEAGREDQSFSSDPASLDASRTLRMCEEGAIPLPRASATRYELVGGQPSYSRFPLCDWLGVDASATDRRVQPVDSLVLHVWGSGIDRRIAVASPPREKVFLTAKPRSSHGEYHAQLERDTEPVSNVFDVATFPNEPGGSCSRNLITLKFVAAERRSGSAVDRSP